MTYEMTTTKPPRKVPLPDNTILDDVNTFEVFIDLLQNRLNETGKFWIVTPPRCYSRVHDFNAVIKSFLLPPLSSKASIT